MHKNNSKMIESLNWRYATKKFDSSREVSDEDLNEILEAARLAPSSFGLQPWKFIVVTNKKLREELKKHAWNQSQVTDASYLVVLCARKNLDEKYVKDFVKDISSNRSIPIESLKSYEDIILGSVNSMSNESLVEWNKRQLYIALGFLMFAAAQKNIDTCPMEGFDSNKFDEILKLKEENLTATVLCTIGYRSKDDNTGSMKKVRFNRSEAFDFRN